MRKHEWGFGKPLFYRQLYDGDPASNTLSWRWVAGLQTAGKTYLATTDNIVRFTNGRFVAAGLAMKASALIEPVTPPQDLPAANAAPSALSVFCLRKTTSTLKVFHWKRRRWLRSPARRS